MMKGMSKDHMSFRIFLKKSFLKISYISYTRTPNFQ